MVMAGSVLGIPPSCHQGWGFTPEKKIAPGRGGRGVWDDRSSRSPCLNEPNTTHVNGGYMDPNELLKLLDLKAKPPPADALAGPAASPCHSFRFRPQNVQFRE